MNLKLIKTALAAVLVMPCILCAQEPAQKKPIDHSVYDEWKTTGQLTLSNNGVYGSVSVSAQDADGYLSVFVFGKKGPEVHSYERGSMAMFTPTQNFLAFRIAPTKAEFTEAKNKKKAAPLDSFALLNLKTLELQKVGFAKSFKTPEEGTDNTVAALIKRSNKEKDKATDLLLFFPDEQFTDTLRSVTEYAFSKDGRRLALVCTEDTTYNIQNGTYIYNIPQKQLHKLLTGLRKNTFYLPVFSDDASACAFYMNPDTLKDQENAIRLYYFNEQIAPNGEAICLADAQSTGLNTGWKISRNASISFNKDGSRVFFGVAPVLPVKDTSLRSDEVAHLDLWHYKDEYLQPMQLKQVNQYRSQSFLSWVDPKNPKHITQLATEDIPQISIPDKNNADWAYATSNKPYRIESQWAADSRSDLYLMSPTDGKTTPLVQGGYLASVSASPDGNYLIWFDKTTRKWTVYQPKTQQSRTLDFDFGVALWNQEIDTPNLPGPYGIGGWLKDDQAFLLYDRYDIWQIDPTFAKDPINITLGEGRKQERTYRLIRPVTGTASAGFRSQPKPFDPKEILYLSVFDNKTKEQGFATLSLTAKKKVAPTLLVLDNHTYTGLQKAKDASLFFYSRNNFEESPNAWYSKDAFRTQNLLTDINPQQASYNWGTAELVHWKANDGRPCDGILYKPEDFDASKKYPMIIYFYERLSDGLYSYKQPAPSRSSINISYFVSNGYLVFTPDIYYTVGHPGKSAMNCIMPGVDMLCRNSWVDGANMAIQGQSWGGYQVAYMVTQTNRFKAAWAGAPVSNMTSAYSGIRWSTGVARNMQYEGGQSRIGKNLWDGFDLYLENSPLFFAENVETPLAIMHNDNDGAVPWYQGIEYFVGLRRLGKQVWLLQYNGEEHNLTRRPNCKDLSQRLGEFFDHFLKGKKAAPWIESGIPAYLKGITVNE